MNFIKFRAKILLGKLKSNFLKKSKIEKKSYQMQLILLQVFATFFYDKFLKRKNLFKIHIPYYL